MAESYAMDPAEESSGRTELDITPWVSASGIDWGDAAYAPYLSESTYGEVPVDGRFPNRQVSLPLSITARGTFTFETARAAIQSKVSLWQREGGILERVTAGGTIYLDVVTADLRFSGDWVQGNNSADVNASITLQALPDWYGSETTLSDHTETTNPELIWTETGIKGNYPARVRIAVDEDDGDNQLGLIFGVRARNYSSATTAKLAYGAEELGPVNNALKVAQAGAQGGTVVQHGTLTTDWLSILTTNIAGTQFLTHTGSYRVWGRARTTSAVTRDGAPVQLRFLSDVGDITLPAENSAIRVPGSSEFYLVDLGGVRLDAPPVGTHRWQGIVQAKGDSGGENIQLDRLWFFNVDEGYGVLRAQTERVEGVGASGQRNGGTAVDDSGVGSFVWSNALQSLLSDWVYASTTLNGGTATHYLKATNFGFSVPTSATITGISLTYKASAGFANATNMFTGGNYLVDNRVRLVKGGTILSTDRAYGGMWPASNHFRGYGGPGDMWGTTWTPAEVNASGFGSALSVTCNSVAFSNDAKVDATWITVYYTTADGSAPGTDAVLYASQSAALGWDGHYREDSTGAAYGPVSRLVGDLPRLPPGGLEGRTTEVMIKASRGDAENLADGGIDDISAKVSYRPCWLVVPA